MGYLPLYYRAQLYRVLGHPERTAVQGVGHPEDSAVQGAYSM